MRVTRDPNEIVGTTATKSWKFSLDAAAHAHIMRMLRNDIYKDPIAAVLREPATNAWDAHRDAGIPDTPIKITLPTSYDHSLKIRDYGKGLPFEAPEGVASMQLFTKFGASTKRGNDNEAGFMGQGCKAPFAYTTSFTVTSWHEGTKTVYVAALDASDMGEMQILHSEDCGDETGIEIQIPTKPHDIEEFYDKAGELFWAFSPLPEINLELPKKEWGTSHPSGAIKHEQGWVGVMGPVPYRIDINQLFSQLNHRNIHRTAQYCGGRLNIPLGTAQVAATREEFRYDAETKEVLADAMLELFTTHRLAVLTSLEDARTTPWQKQMAAYGARVMRISLPAKWKAQVPFAHPDLIVTMPSDKRDAYKTTHVMSCHPDTTLFIRDDKRTLRGYWQAFPTRGYIVRPAPRVTPAEFKRAVTMTIAKAGVGGMPVRRLSTLDWHMDPKAKPNKKRIGGRAFRLVGTARRGSDSPLSENWEKDDGATDKTPYVLLKAFVAHSSAHQEIWNFQTNVRQDRTLANAVGVPYPDVFGFRLIAGKAKPVGIPYEQWRKQWHKSLWTKANKRASQRLAWMANNNSHPTPEFWRTVWETWGKALGKRHPVTKFVRRIFKAHEALAKGGKPSTSRYSYDRKQGPDEQRARALARIEGFEPVRPATVWGDEIQSRYPLATGLSILTKEDMRPHWVQYIQLVDKDTPQMALTLPRDGTKETP
jgi:hypothetical protein